MIHNQQDDLRVSEEATLWLLRLRHENTSEIRAAFDAWIKQGASNLEEFYFAQALWQEFDQIDGATVRKLWQAEGNVSIVDFPIQKSTGIAAHPLVSLRRPRWAIGLAASVVLALVGWMAFAVFPLGARVYSTAVGSQEAIKLGDGSVMHLNTDSRAQVRYSDRERTIRLIQGEALFTVAPDAARPFIVVTDNARIRALGTQFNVYLSDKKATRVTVLDGAVQAEVAGNQGTMRLAAGDAAQVSQHGVVKDPASDVKRAVAWRTRQLIFPGDRVADIVREFNRYNRVQIHVEGEAILEHKMSGVFDADDSTAFLKFLSNEPNIVIVPTNTRILVRPRTDEDDRADAHHAKRPP